MSAIGSIISGLGSIAALAYPPAAPFIGFLERIEPYAETAMPLIKAAISEGPAAFTAAKQAAPDLFKQIHDLAAALKKQTGDTTPVTDKQIANLAAHIVGIDPPGWTHDETERWWARAQGES